MPASKKPRKQPISKAKSTPPPQKVSENPKSRRSRPVKKADQGDSTVRASVHPSPNEPGPTASSKGKTTDTRAAASKKPGARKEQAQTPAPVTASELVAEPTAAEIAANQPLRQSDLPTPTELHKIDGEPVEVVAIPSRVDPVELKPSKRDTVVKDRARTEGQALAADAPKVTGIGGDILEGVVGESRFTVDEKTGDLSVAGYGGA